MERPSDQRTSIYDRQSNASIVIHDQDIPVLIGVRDATFIGLKQLREMLQYRNHHYTRDQLKYRIVRLAKAGLFDVHPQVAIMRGMNYSISRYGLSCLESYGHSLVSIGSESARFADPVQIVHALHLNDIMLNFYATGKASLWLTDRLVRDRNVSSTRPFAKDYDVVCVLARRDGNKHAVGIEFERSLKSRDRYLEIKKRIASEVRLAYVLYFIANPTVIPMIAGYLGDPPRCKVLYVSMGEFRRDGFAAQAHYLSHEQQENTLIRSRLSDILSLDV